MLTNNNLPEIPALLADDELPARGLATEVRSMWGLSDDQVEQSAWSWLDPLTERTEAIAPAVMVQEPATSEVSGHRSRDGAGAQNLMGGRRAPSRPRRRQVVIMAAFFAVGALVLGGIGVAVASIGSDTAPAPTLVADPSKDASAAPPPDPCPERAGSGKTAGDGAGDQKSGPGAILAWNHAYYVSRSARQAKSVTTTGAVATEADLQKVIDGIPQGTTHCVAITDRGAGRYSVVLTVTTPGVALDVFNQAVQTTHANGRWWIESIRKEETRP